MPINITTGSRTETADAPTEPAELPPPAKPNKLLTAVIDGAIILLTILLAVVIRQGALGTTIVTSGSMTSTIAIGDRLLVDRRRSLHGRFQRGDIIMFQTPAAWGRVPESLVKRIIGLPGEQLEIRGGQVWINGSLIPEVYLKEPPDADFEGPFSLGPGQYFVMGDNRNYSDDSRAHGPIQDQDIQGRITYKIVPFGAIDHPTY